MQRRPHSTALLDSYHAAGPLLPTLFASSVVGVAVVDRQMRFRAINGALAAMNGLPAPRHLGKKLRHVLGAAAPKVESATDQVLQKGEPVALDLIAELPSRAGIGHWTESYFPIRDAEARVRAVAVVVLEISEKRNWEQPLRQLIANLDHLRAALRTELRFLSGMSGLPDEHSILLAQALELAQKCIAEGENLCKLALLSPSIKAPQWELPLRQGLEPPSGTSSSDIDRRERREPGAYRRLSPREHAVLQLLADGKNNKEVGAVLGISVRTAEAYRARMMKKVEVHSLAQLVRFAVRNKIIEP